MMRLVNCTPHPITIADKDGNVIRTIEPSGHIARVAVEQQEVGVIDGIPVVESVFGQVEGLPDPEPGVVYIVSTPTMLAARQMGRTDVVSPDTGPASAVRDEQGRIVAVRRFQR